MRCTLRRCCDCAVLGVLRFADGLADQSASTSAWTSTRGLRVGACWTHTVAVRHASGTLAGGGLRAWHAEQRRKLWGHQPREVQRVLRCRRLLIRRVSGGAGSYNPPEQTPGNWLSNHEHPLVQLCGKFKLKGWHKGLIPTFDVTH